MSTEHRFEFDEWAELARDNPELFEARRQAVIEEFIRKAAPAHRARLRGLQFRIDMERRRSRTPLGACIRLYQLTLDAFYRDFAPSIGALPDPAPPGRGPGEVLAFRSADALRHRADIGSRLRQDERFPPG